MGIYSCSGSNLKNRHVGNTQIDAGNLQSYVDSSAKLYLEAINEVQVGKNLDSVRLKYATDIHRWHSLLSNSFDSLTVAYMNKVISQEDYDNFRKTLFLDSVEQRSKRLSKLGVQIDLN
ncbi:hypothetical protein [Taibaiella helva]|uniref:hypothetical protein n=1 Tax=Taibaiella helva TaxID=2301235 RepID=UPI00130038D6|nr:hypothetical protein [Taibaiella helva]